MTSINTKIILIILYKITMLYYNDLNTSILLTQLTIYTIQI